MLSAAAARSRSAAARGAVGAITPLILVLLLVRVTIVARGFRIGQILVVDPAHDLHVAPCGRREGGHVLHEA